MIRKGATAIAAFDLCPRRWAFDNATFAIEPSGTYRWLDKAEGVGAGVNVALPAPSSPWQAVGTAVHAVIEGFYKGTPIDTRTEAGLIAMAGVHHLPRPSPSLWVERSWSLPLGRHQVTGTFDLVDVDDGVPIRLYDHKTSGDISKWAKSAEQLADDTQAILYTWAVLTLTGWSHRVELPAQWTYFLNRRPYGSKPVNAVVHVKEERLRRMERTLDAMTAAEGCDPLRDLPAVPSACSAFGRCPYESRCGLTMGQRLNGGERRPAMATRFKTYDEARAWAEQQTFELSQAHGIEKQPGYHGETEWSVFMLPKPENRYGYELRCEAVEIGTPRSERTMSTIEAMKKAMQNLNPPPMNGTARPLPPPPPPDDTPTLADARAARPRMAPEAVEAIANPMGDVLKPKRGPKHPRKTPAPEAAPPAPHPRLAAYAEALARSPEPSAIPPPPPTKPDALDQAIAEAAATPLTTATAVAHGATYHPGSMPALLRSHAAGLRAQASGLDALADALEL